MNTVIVIGAGASGMMAAISAAGAGASVLLLEGGQKPGKKLLVTGNGRCNLTNLSLNPALYQGDGAALAGGLLGRFGVKDTISFFERIGVPTLAVPSARGEDQYVYPRCKEAAAVRDALEMECERLGVILKNESRVIRLEKRRDGSFLVETADHEAYASDRVILAAGGLAAPKTGSDGSGLELARELGHSICFTQPALGALEVEEKTIRNLAGIRTEACVTLTVNGKAIAQEIGEVQFTEYGLSGIPVFQLSGRAAQALSQGMKVELHLDFWPELSREKLFMQLTERRVRRQRRDSLALLAGMLPAKMIPTILDMAHIPPKRSCAALDKHNMMVLTELIQDLCFTVSAPRGYESCQVTSGGVSCREVTDELESILIKGLFFSGELLDVDGPCGGYNLQWAWTSGRIAGQAAAQR